MFVTNKALGGGDWHYDPPTGAGQKGISGATGLNNIGLLVRVQGKVTAGAPGDAGPVFINDGSGVNVQIVLPPGATSAGYGAWVAVTGVASCAKEHQQTTGPADPTYEDFQRRVVLARDMQTLQPGPQWVYPGEMVYIPAGGFLMGNNGQEGYSDPNELPQHSVNLSGYYIGKYEVTRGEYRQFMNAGGYSNPAYWSSAGRNWKGSRTEPDYWAAEQNWGSPPGAFTQTDNHPVVGVNYYEAEAFCNWAGGHLPTEAQWEKAARWDGHPRVYPWGAAWDQQRCNNGYDSLYSGYQTAPVGSYPSSASPYGCIDMAGNVWEWVQDWYRSYPSSSTPFDYTGACRVLRGGGWSNSGSVIRCAFRGLNGPSGIWHGQGFRIAR